MLAIVMNQSETRQVMQRACHLVFFLHDDKTMALQIVSDALSKFETAAAIQDKRLYYEPSGGWRGARQQGWRSKVRLNDLGLLQYLVYLESEPYEQMKEQSLAGGSPVGDEMLLRHYIKHLVMQTVARNSFYVTLGISRLLFNYTTTEAVALYQTIVQNPDRQKFDSYWRERKLKLLQELKKRFGGFLELNQERGKETKFQTREDSSPQMALVAECLQMFTPWMTNCSVTAEFGNPSFLIPSLAFNGQNPDGEHQIEMNRMHSIIHWQCFDRLAQGLGLKSPLERLELPKFSLASGNHENSPPDNTKLTKTFDEQDLDDLQRRLDNQSRQRCNVTPSQLRILASGIEKTRLHLQHTATAQFELAATPLLLEVRTIESEGDLLLATHLLRESEWENSQTAAIVLEGGQRIRFAVVPMDDDQLQVTVHYSETDLARNLALGWRRWQQQLAGMSEWQSPGTVRLGWTLATLLALSASGLIWWFTRPQESKAPLIALTVASSTPTGSLSESPPPLPGNGNFVAATRAPQTSNPKNDEPDVLRTPNKTSAVNTLHSVNRLFVEVSGGESATHAELRAELTTQLQAANRWQFSNRDEADALLKVESSMNGKRLTVWLVNAEGVALWPRVNNKRGRIYQGEVESVVRRIVADLLAEARRTE